MKRKILVFISAIFLWTTGIAQIDSTKIDTSTVSTTSTLLNLPQNLMLPGLDITQATNYNVIPQNPHAASLGSYGNLGINEATGTPAINIPVYTISEDGVNVPISLSYDATGIRVEDISTEVGLKWSLNAGGSVSRTIRGLADDDTDGWFNYSGSNFPSLTWNNNEMCYQYELGAVSDNTLDVIPDLFSYNFLGHNGQLFFEQDETMHKAVDDDLKIEPSFSVGGISTEFVIYDSKGVKYEFDIAASTTTSSVAGSIINSSRSASGTTEWKLSKITTPNNKTIDFTYESYTVEYTLSNSEVKKNGNSSAPSSNDLTVTHKTDYDLYMKLLSQIETDDIKVTFIYSTDASADIWQKKLTEIKVFDKIHSESRSYILEYGRYNNDQLQLQYLKEKGTSGNTSDKVWSFSYNGSDIPSNTSMSVDYFGYYNGASNTGYIPIYLNRGTMQTYDLNDRDVNSSYISKGILNQIEYPTKGKTKFYYEPNEGTDKWGNDIYAPGVRVSKMEDIDHDGTIIKIKEYTYSGLDGKKHLKENYSKYWRYYEDSMYEDYIYYSSPVADKNFTIGYGYSKVEILHNYMRSGSPGTDALKSYTEVKKYELMRLNNTIHPKLIEVKLLDGNSNIVKRTENIYSEVSTSVQVDGWVIQDVFQRDDLVNDCDPYSWYQFMGESYYSGVYKDIHCYSHGTVSLDQTITVDYSNSESDSVKVTEEYDYDSNLQLEKVTKKEDNQKETLLTYVTYPNDYPTDGTMITLNSKHLVSLPVTVTQKRKFSSTEYVANKRKYDYDTSGNITKDYDFDDGNSDDLDLKNELTYLSGTKKIRQIKSRGDEYVTYLWSYGKSKPVAKIQNASYSQVSSSAGASLISNLENATSQSSIDSYLSQLQTNLSSLSDVLVTIYKYRPLFGVDEIIDPTGVKTSYNYDEFGRLLEVKNDDSKLLNKYDYNYK